jgi:hypothetical protein
MQELSGVETQMDIFEDTNPRSLKDLLSEIRSLVTVLPDFQRDFVWEPGATQELITSIANNYPAGSILRVRDTRKIFASREFEGAPKLNGHKNTSSWYWTGSNGLHPFTRPSMVSANIATTSI